MPRGFFVLAGPQCAGKSTAKSYLYAKHVRRDPARPPSAPDAHHNLVLLPEMRQVVMHERGIHSAIFIDAATEDEIIRRDLARLDAVLAADDDEVYLDETNVFTLAHAGHRGVDVEKCLESYQARLHALDASVIFLDVPPAVSWRRRRAAYRRRVLGFPAAEARTVMAMYRRYMGDLYDGLISLKRILDVPVYDVDASRSQPATLGAAARVFQELVRMRRITVSSRF